jgi:hypothetical protein
LAISSSSAIRERRSPSAAGRCPVNVVVSAPPRQKGIMILGRRIGGGWRATVTANKVVDEVDGRFAPETIP